MKILLTMEKGTQRDIYFPAGVLQALKSLGQVTLNQNETPFTSQALIRSLQGVDVCLTHWGCPTFTSDVLEKAPQLRLIVHAAGSVADLVTEQVYERGIKVCSANSIMAQYVAEGVLAYILAGLRWIPQQASDMQHHVLWEQRTLESESLIGAKMGLIGLGTIGRFLLELLKPFHVQIKLYDPYVAPDSLKDYRNVELSSLEDVLTWADILSIHSSLTHETRGMLSADRLRMIKNGALLVNTARGAIVDEQALIDELRQERFRAVLDVYDTEPLPLDSPLRDMKNVILLPHVAGIPAREIMSYAMLEEIQRYSKGEPLRYEIPAEKFRLMTKEHLF
jgi:phosphoglycerate dehydrogenase-like enzyme